MSDETRAWKDQYMLRLPDGLRDRLKATAAENGRSLNAEIVFRLLETLERETQAAPPVIAREPLQLSSEDFDRLVRDIRQIKSALKVDEK